MNSPVVFIQRTETLIAVQCAEDSVLLGHLLPEATLPEYTSRNWLFFPAPTRRVYLSSDMLKAIIAKQEELNLKPTLEQQDEVELSYWRFDARRKGYAIWSHTPMSERDAYKAEMNLLLSRKETECYAAKNGYDLGPVQKAQAFAESLIEKAFPRDKNEGDS